jgi:hypothetical protein
VQFSWPCISGRIQKLEREGEASGSGVTVWLVLPLLREYHEEVILLTITVDTGSIPLRIPGSKFGPEAGSSVVYLMTF